MPVETIEEARLRIETLLDIGLHATDLDVAFATADQAQQLASSGPFESEPYRSAIARALYIKAFYHHHRSETSAALEILETTLTFLDALDDPLIKGRIYAALAAACRQINDFTSAIDADLQQLAIFQASDNQDGIARAYYGMGMTYSAMQQPEQSLVYLHKSLTILRHLGTKGSQAMTLGLICRESALIGDLDGALAAGLEGLTLYYEETDVPHFSECDALLGLARVYWRRGQLDQAAAHLQRAQAVATTLRMDAMLVRVLRAQGEFQLVRGPDLLPQAIEYFTQALAIAITAHQDALAYELHDLLADCYKQQRNFEQALLHFEQFHHLKEKLFDAQSDQRFKYLEVKSRTEAAVKDAAFLSQKNQELEHLHAQDKLYFERLNRLRDDLLNSASHNLKNPISIINLALYKLRQQVPLNDDRSQQAVNDIERQVQRMSTLIYKVLDLAKLETGRALEVHEFILQPMLMGCVEDIMPSALEKGVHIELRAPTAPLVVSGDTHQLGQAVLNLLSNAVKYTASGGQVVLEVQQTEAVLILRVSDTGVGIPEADLPRIFDRFYRVPQHAKLAEGTGLGLSIVKTIIEQHQGTIHTESTPEVGSTFKITLPAHNPASGKVPSPNPG